jgi:hypothetical protein
MKLIDPVKTAYDRLYRKSIRKTRDQIRVAFEDLGIDSENANSEQVDCVIQHLLEEENQIVSQVTEEIIQKVNDPQNLEQFPVDYSDDGKKDLSPFSLEGSEGSLVLTQSQKISIVQEQSMVLGAKLNNEQIIETASKMIGSYISFEESIFEVKEIILDIVRQQFKQAEAKLVQSLNEIADTANEGYELLTKRSAVGFNAVQEQLTDRDQNFKKEMMDLKSRLRDQLHSARFNQSEKVDLYSKP